ncbi:MAG: prepilin-type N-terminal cleavage/methylation domain-containing protein [Gammaproteobacteria bacterium]|nr:prepilin-type N-terminal cleavage/methylation domain-containing protein [Gammaproteobacteria bacterium]
MSVTMPRVKRRRRQESGFSLIEVLIALIVVAIALLALMEGMGAIIHTQSQLRQQAQAQQVAWQQWQSLRLGGGYKNEKLTVVHGEQSWQVTSEFTDTDFPGTRQVTIRVLPSDDLTGRALLLSALVVTP